MSSAEGRLISAPHVLVSARSSDRSEQLKSARRCCLLHSSACAIVFAVESVGSAGDTLLRERGRLGFSME
jgi:hypothetical protein